MNNFGGDWTENKIEILVEYAGAYLNIMNIHAKKYGWKLLYFDGFAGSGFIKKGKLEDQKLIIGAARRILEIEDPRSFDMFYFVEKESENAELLKANTKDQFPDKNIRIVTTDCNKKIKALSNFLSSPQGHNYKVLAYIDPCGMQLNWESLVALQKLSVDVWILIPTGMGVNRLLKKDSNISDAWVSKLEIFLGMNKQEILNSFYKESVTMTLFGEEVKTTKEENAVEKSAELYKSRLGSLFKYVSEPYILKNRSNSTMFHFLMASNNRTAVKIANEIIQKYNRKN
ncbi:three-Cys-motif partner protein TcmP [Niabella beijingensis]|uniref:three-Cys-motif partner protein TcmP n=1 Tax=Niabella beijingensis TaxID=2872700 RepID=UPI001CBC0312|nr:three-Cys-motif partner protein TcmP [Niabella beijingensis]MBZ4191717.1 three-Cys-motif partner protein TcmP [Niabella beijingensis]